jgi:hypothetical protein
MAPTEDLQPTGRHQRLPDLARSLALLERSLRLIIGTPEPPQGPGQGHAAGENPNITDQMVEMHRVMQSVKQHHDAV